MRKLANRIIDVEDRVVEAVTAIRTAHAEILHSFGTQLYIDAVLE